MTDRTDPRATLQRARILEAAGRCLAKHGFQRATIDEIAAAASLSRPVLYKHFAGKDALIAETAMNANIPGNDLGCACDFMCFPPVVLSRSRGIR